MLDHIKCIFCSNHLRKWKHKVNTYPRGVMIVWYWRSMISVGVWCHISTWHIIILTVGLTHLLCIWMWLLLLLSRYCIRYCIWTNTKIDRTILRMIWIDKNIRYSTVFMHWISIFYTYQSSGSQSLNPFANGLLAIFSWVIYKHKQRVLALFLY